MIPLGLSSPQQAQLHTALTSTHTIRVTVQLLTNSHVRLADISGRLLDGQVNIDSAADVTRSCTLSLLDPDRSLDFDSDSPNDGAIYADRMVQVNYSVHASFGWVTIPLFTGPITKMDRADDVVNIEAQGKEILAMGAAWIPQTWKRGTLKHEVIRSVLANAGEVKFTLQSSTARLATDYSIGRENTPWGVARHIASGMGLHLFYDGRGVARLRSYPQTSCFWFETGDGGTVLSPPQISYSTDDLKNVVWVRGGVPRGAKTAVWSIQYAPITHPLSPSRLGRNGKGRYLLEIVDDTSIVTHQQALDVAVSTLDRLLMQSVDVSFDALPIPHLEPSDVVRLNTVAYSNAFRVRQLSIPLLADQPMSVGYLNRLWTNRRKIRG